MVTGIITLKKYQRYINNFIQYIKSFVFKKAIIKFLYITAKEHAKNIFKQYSVRLARLGKNDVTFNTRTAARPSSICKGTCMRL